nr:MAG TPA: hypothetical protein [Caudoviricetes sp.]
MTRAKTCGKLKSANRKVCGSPRKEARIEM